VVLMGLWRYDVSANTLPAAMKAAERVYSLAQQQNDPALIIGGCVPLAITLYFSGDFETGRKYTTRGLQILRSGIQSPIEDVDVPAVSILCLEALFDWHAGGIVSCHPTMTEAISLARELNDMHGLAVALWDAGWLAYFERDSTGVERCASELIELSVRQNFMLWLAGGKVLRGWARSASGDTEGISETDEGIRGMRATGQSRGVPGCLLLKAEALHLADRTHEALAVLEEAEAVVERSEERWCFVELQRLHGLFLVAVGGTDDRIEALFRSAISTAKQQKSLSLEKRAEATYAEYCRQKASAAPGHGFRLPLI
jgi:hypothetical protein